jgi:cytochrome o ubiquinol oxidase subunit 2
VAWRSSHTLDPTVAIASPQPAVHIQVVALQWKWLFIYPDQHIATINKLMIPVNRPVHFDITADAPMNSFWIPQLGGQIYAMPGMSTQLSLEASKVGTYRGSSANLSGAGFASMDFRTDAVSAQAYKQWLNHSQHSDKPVSLTASDYEVLRQPSEIYEATYNSVDSGLFQSVVDRFMSHQHASAEAGL